MIVAYDLFKFNFNAVSSLNDLKQTPNGRITCLIFKSSQASDTFSVFLKVANGEKISQNWIKRIHHKLLQLNSKIQFGFEVLQVLTNAINNMQFVMIS